MFLTVAIVATLVAGSVAFTPSDRGDCTDIMANALGYPMSSGVYHLLIGDGKRSKFAYCDMTTHGGGWTVIQRRTGPYEDFERTWKEYENGFGNASGDYWLGNTYIHSLTKNKRYVLRIEMTEFITFKKNYVEYDDFIVGGAGCNYTLESLGNFCGSCGDSLSAVRGQKFSTKGVDNDSQPSENCAVTQRGGWWFGESCFESNLNGLYKIPNEIRREDDGIFWHKCNEFKPYQAVVMMIRPYFF